MSRRLKYATFCSGIECMSVACRGLPLDPVFFSEIEPFPCAVLKANYPTIPNLGDMSKIRRDENGNITNGTTTIPFPDGGIDILAAGCPCQDFSIAGKRAGGAEGSGTRSSLIFEFIRIIGEIRPRWFIYENVVGMLSTNEGRDFAHILLAFRDCGYSVAYRTLDAQYVRVDGMERAVPQRRRRVWVVGCLGADESLAGKILFEPDCVAGHTAPRRRAGEGFAYSLARRDRVDAPVVGEPAGCEPAVARTLERRYDSSPCIDRGQNCIALDGDKLKPREDQRKGGNGFGINEEGADYTLTAADRHGVAYGMDARNTGLYGEKATGKEVSMTQDANQCKGGKCVVLCADGGLGDEREVSPTLSHKPSALEPTVAQSNIAQMRYIVRRLTPTECERLMGLPDGYTIPAGLDANDPALVAEFQRIFDTFGAIMADYAHKKPPKPKSAKQVADWLKKISDPATCPDSPRYKGCGNGWATNQPRWILMRLLAIGEGMDPFDNQQEAKP